MLEVGPTSKYNVKLFPSQAGQTRERAGFIGQINYKPHVTDDTDLFYSPTQDFASNEFLTVPLYAANYPQAEEDKFELDGPEIADARGRFFGPVSLFGKRAVDATWDYLNSLHETYNDAGWRNVAGADYAISAFDAGRSHVMILSFEGVENMSFDIEVTRHWEIIPGEESPLEICASTLSHAYSSPLDLVRRFPIADLLGNPFAPLGISTTYTAWGLDPVIMAQSNALRVLSSLSNETKEERIKGLFQDGVKWLLKNVGIKALDWLNEKAHDWIDSKVKGGSYALTYSAASGDDECVDDYEVAENDVRNTGIEKNPGPTLK